MIEKSQILRENQSTLKETIAIKAIPVEALITETGFDDTSHVFLSQNLDLWESKFGGTPYFPKSLEYPKNKEGHPLTLLAQINCKDLPSSCYPFPKEGLLQFYIDTEDDLYGMDLDESGNQRGGYQVTYIADPGCYEDQSALSFSEGPYSPIDGPHKLSFQKTSQMLCSKNFNYDKYYEKYLDHDSKEEEFLEIFAFFEKSKMPIIHQMGGYASCIQEMPDYLQDDDLIVLLKIGYDDKISFGDSGECLFFIHKEKLKNLDFSDVYYYWDCF